MTTDTFVPSGEVAGLTDRPRLPRLGKIHLGIRKLSQKGTEYPSPTDFFVVPKVIQDAGYGEKPRELDVVFPSDEIGRVAGVSWKQYTTTRGKVCWGDGERAIRTIDVDKLPRDGREVSQEDWDAALVSADSKRVDHAEIPCPAEDCVFAKRNACKVVMNLLFMLPRVPGIGVWQLDTGSTNSILDVRGGIELVRKLSGGVLAGIPLKLRLEPMEVISPDDQKKKIVHTLKLISPATLNKVLLSGDRNLRELLMADQEIAKQVQLPARAEEVPSPEEPETDLFPHTETTSRGDSSGDGAGPSSGATPSAAERDRSTVEVAGSSPAPRSDDTAALEARAEQLFHELGIPENERRIFRGAHKGRAADLVKFLEANLAKRKPKA